MKRTMRCRRGISLVETLIAAALFVLVAIAMANLSWLGTVSFARTDATLSAKQALAKALLRMGPSIRGAMHVDTASATATKLALVMPKTDSTGSTVLPLEDGNTVVFYLSDTTGSATATGTILWRSVNGVPDSAWSLRSGKGYTDLGTQGLSFTYFPTNDPESVQLTVTTTQSSGTRQASGSASTTAYMRNSRYQ